VKTTKRHPIKLLREQNHVTQAQLSELSGVSRRTVSSVERGIVCHRETRRKLTLVLRKLKGYDPEANYFPEWQAWGPKQLPLEGWLWLEKQTAKGRYDSAAHHLTQQGYTVPSKAEVAGAMKGWM